MDRVTALDLETTGLNPWRDEILLIGSYDGENYNPQTTEFNSDLVCHRSGFDIRFLRVKNLFPKDYPFIIHDTAVMAHICTEKVPKQFLDWYEEDRKRRNKELPKGQTYRETSALSLKVLAPWFLKVEPFWEKPGQYDDQEYNFKDNKYTFELFHLFKKKLIEQGSWDFYLRVLRWQKMILEMELRGIRIDLDELDLVEKEYIEKRVLYKHKLDGQWASERDRFVEIESMFLKQKYQEMAQEQIVKGKDPLKAAAKYNDLYLRACQRIKPLNYASSQQMTWLLKEQLGLDITDPEGEETTGKSVLNRLAQERDDIKNLLEYKEADKVLTMYVPTYKELQVDSIIHPSFNLTGTRTGRTSSSSPNLQQVPSKLYRLFKPRSGYKFIQYDLSGIEAALIALYSGDKTLYDILAKGESIHDHNAKALFGLECDVSEVSKLFPKQRKIAKTIGFACFYGAGFRRVSSAFASGGSPISDGEAKAKLKQLKAYYPQAFEFHEEVTEIFESGEVVRNLFGRPIKIQPHENAYMQGFNTLIQSSASDLNLRACEKASKKWKELDLDAYPLLVIHDCIVAEAREEVSKQCEQILIDAMTQFRLESINGAIQLRVEGGITDVWSK